MNRCNQGTLEKLHTLLEQNQFELIFPEDGNDIYLVYMMNDAVESFLVFKNAKMTGEYQKDYEGTLETVLSLEHERNALVVHQGSSVLTIFFEDLELEVHLYAYGEIGHFWVRGYEYLRQLEYRIAILRDKCFYLEEGYSTPLERTIAQLADFPPLNACCYPAVSSKYIVFGEHPWKPSKEALEVMADLAKEAGDQSLLKVLGFYKKHQGKWVARLIAGMLHRNAHAGVIDLLTEKIRQAASIYPNRPFEEPDDMEKMRKAKKRQEALLRIGRRSEILREEPFLFAKDSIEFKVYLMIWKRGILNRKVEIECIE